jgi:high affinity Mn2+ porin
MNFLRAPICVLGLCSTFCALADVPDTSNFHVQGTTVTQAHSSFYSPYYGTNSLSGQGETKTSFTSTLFLGHALWWPGSQIYVDPEVSAGEGLSQTHGVAGFPNGEIYRVDSPSAKLYVSRVFIQQVIGLGGGDVTLDDDQNQLSVTVDQNRLTFVLGRFSLNDYFDNNTYSHDPRTQFLNWSLMDNGAWDYAADTRGYTWGLYAEYNRRAWAVRAAMVLEPVVANGEQLDPHFWQAYGANLEFEYRYDVLGHPGRARFLSYMNRADMGSYAEAMTISPYDITVSREYRTKFGFGLNLEQELTADIGGFMRIGWNNGTTETWNFTEVDKTVSAGLSIRGNFWHRKGDTVGVAVIANGLSPRHRDYLAGGGYGFILGDGAIGYQLEEIGELYYLYRVNSVFAVTGDFQYVIHPGDNMQRGPVPIYGLRLHAEI